MLKALPNAIWRRDFRLFMENFSTPPKLALTGFHPVQFPVVISEAHVKMRTVEDYSILSLLILRLFDAGIRDPEAIESISGMSPETVKSYIQKEFFLLGHIDPNTNELTKLGRETLEKNENLGDKQPQSAQNYDGVIRVHIEPLTASLIPQYLEWEQGENIVPDEKIGDFLIPPAAATPSEAFRQELRTRLIADINSRMEEHITCDALKNGNVLDYLQDLLPIRIFYRWGYLAMFEGMQRPMIVFTGKRAADNVNADTQAAGVRTQLVAMPIAIAQSESAYLERNGVRFHKVLTRSDTEFDTLVEMTRNMTLTLPDLSEGAQGAPQAETEGIFPVEADWDEPDPGSFLVDLDEDEDASDESD